MRSNYVTFVFSRYAPSFHTCHVKTTDPPPYAVSLVVEKCDVSKSHLRLHNQYHPHQGTAALPKTKTTPAEPNRGKPHPDDFPRFNFESIVNHDEILNHNFKYNYSVCVTPFNFNYRDIHQLVEIIEVNRLFGADHFVFYNYDSSPDIQPYLKYYIEKGIVDVLPWNIPVKVNVWPPESGHSVEIHYFAQLVALNDCVYRSMSNSKYAVLTDVDEIIVPQFDTSWDKMLARVEHSDDIGAWMFQNSFFRMDWPDEELADPEAKEYQLRTLRKLKREAEIFPPYSRSKLILRPQLITMTGIHFVYKHLPGVKTFNVEPHDGLLHHYRKGFDGTNKFEVKVDAKIMNQYRSPIIARVKRVFDTVGLYPKA